MAAAIALGSAGAAVLVLKAKRPEVLSSGSIAFALGVLSLLVFILLFISSRRKDPAQPLFSPGRLDIFYAASVAVSLASFLASSRSRENFLQPYLLVTAFAVYLLVRTGRVRLQGRPAALLAGVLVAIAATEAVHGLAQWASGREMKGFFFNVNHFAMFLAMVVPIAWAAARPGKVRLLRILGYGAILLMLVAIVLSRCRTAYTALILVAGLAFLLGRLPRSKPGNRPPRPGRSAVRAALLWGATGLIVVAALAVSFKPMSAAGRLLIWKVSFRTALARPFAGTGFGNFPAVYNTEQGRYFSKGNGTATERLSAEAGIYAFNDYLESFAELGLMGLLVLLPFWGLALKATADSLRLGMPPSKNTESSPDERLAFGAAGSVLAFMIMSFFYCPSRILPLALLFSAFLGWIARDGRPVSDKARRSFKGFIQVFAAAAFLTAVLLLPMLWKRFTAERSWAEAIALDRTGRTSEAVAVTRAVLPRLKSDADFVDFHAGLLLRAGEVREAADVLDRALAVSSNPRLMEKLAAARLELGDSGSALKLAQEADSILPWRLTSKSLLAEISARLGDAGEASRYARLVLDTPMKIRTAAGEALKSKAFSQWTELRPRAGDEGNPLLDLLAELPPEHRGGVLAALQAMGTSGRAEAFIRTLRAAEPEEKICLAFLLANMPDRDIRELDPLYLNENVRLACRARRTMSLAAGVPDDIFLDYVLPYAAADEPRERWRADFLRRFRDAAESSPVFEEAFVRLNREVILQFRLVFAEKSVRRRLVGPLRTIARRFVSCGDISLLLVDACRAVGIPARLAILPRYRGLPGGHIWVEVWEAGRWRHISAYEPGYLDQTWISRLIPALYRPGERGVVFAPIFRRTGLRPMPGWDAVFSDISENYLK